MPAAKAWQQVLREELQDWALSIGVERMVTLLAPAIPGARELLWAYRCHQAMDHLQRGQLLRALPGLSALVQLSPELSGMLHSRLHSLLPCDLQGIPDHRDGVVLLAGLAWLAGDEAPSAGQDTAAGATLRWALQALRGSMEVVSSLRMITSNAAANSNVQQMRIDGPSPPFAPDGNGFSLEQRPSFTGEWNAVACHEAPPQSTLVHGELNVRLGDLLPGAHAAKQAARPPIKPGASVTRSKVTSSSSRSSNGRRSTFKVGRGNRGKRKSSGVSLGTRTASEVQPLAQSETNAAPKLGAASPALAPSASVAMNKQKNFDAAMEAHAMAPGHRPIVAPPRVPSQNSGDHDGPGFVAASNQSIYPPALPVRPPPAAPACLRFLDPQRAAAELRDTRYEQGPLRYCVHAQLRAGFVGALSEAMSGPDGEGPWLTAHAITEDLPQALRQLSVHKLGALEQRATPDIQRAEQLGSDAVMSVVSIAEQGYADTDGRTAQVDQLLSANSFRLLALEDLGGSTHLLIAFFVQRGSGADTVIGAGFIDVSQDEGRYSVDDAASGSLFTADSLDDLLSGLQDLSGCRYLAPSNRRVPGGDAAITPPAPQPASRLWVDTRQLHSSTAQRFMHGLPMCAVVPVPLPGMYGQHALFRSTFTTTDRRVDFVDATGNHGSLLLVDGDQGGYHEVLYAETALDQLMAQRAGLSSGKGCALTGLIEAMEGAGMRWIVHPSEIPQDEGEGQSAVHPAPLPAARMTPKETSDATTSWFAFHFTVPELHYCDEHGRTGTLKFNKQRPPQKRYRLLEPAGSHERTFADRNGLVVGSDYNGDEIIWKLEGNGLAPRQV